MRIDLDKFFDDPKNSDIEEAINKVIDRRVAKERKAKEEADTQTEGEGLFSFFDRLGGKSD